MPGNLNVLFLAAEADPFVKVGGLGDVARALPLYLRGLHAGIATTRRADVRLVLPMHSVIEADRHKLRPTLMFSLARTSGAVQVNVFSVELEGMPVYFLDAEPVSRRAPVYSSDPGLDGEKYTFFPLAALELTRYLDWKPQIVHANDWHSALACYALLLKRREGELPGVASVLTVHNLPYVGPDVAAELETYGLARVQMGLPERSSRSPLPLGLWAADAIVAVSPSYAHEIQTPEFGGGLQGYLRARRESVHGILNGIDVDSMNPALDPAIASNFGIPTLDRRGMNKEALQARVGLQADVHVPLMAVISRLDPQKGIDLVPPALRRLRLLKWQIVILGTGAPRLERSMMRLEAEFPDRVRVAIKYDATLARQIYAGADMLLMPSRYEPCGLAQMIAMRYGCIPVVSAVGGLKDTVTDNETGFVMTMPTAARLATAIGRAAGALATPARWEALQRAGMAKDFSWAASARKYLDLYDHLLAQMAVGDAQSTGS